MVGQRWMLDVAGCGLAFEGIGFLRVRGGRERKIEMKRKAIRKGKRDTQGRGKLEIVIGKRRNC